MGWFTRWRNDDEGLTLIEVVASMMIFGFLIAGTAGLTISGLRGMYVSRMDTAGKNLTQQRLEKMRNLPFFVSATITGGSPDLFDKYYVNTTTAAATTSSSGFVANGGARDTANGDPATGPFYRTVQAASTDPKFAAFTQRITVQLLNADGSIIPNPSFDSTSTGTAGLEPAQVVGVNITTLWSAANKQKRFSVFSKIADADSKAPVVVLQARMTALRVNGQLPLQRALLMETGVIDLNGSLSSSTSASAVAAAARGSIDNGSSLSGATDFISAPPTASHTSVNGSQFTLQDALENNAPVGSVGQSAVSNVGGSVLNGNPTSGSVLSPVTATLFGNNSGSGSLSLIADNEPNLARLRLNGSVVQVSAPACGGSCSAVTGTGYVTTTSGATHSATSSISGSVAGTIELFPTDFAPAGVVQIVLSSPMTLTCKSQAGSSPPATATATYTATLRYWSQALNNYSQWISLSGSNSADPLTTNLLTTPVANASDGTTLTLGDYVSGWSSLTSTAMNPATAGSATKVTTGGTSVQSSFPGFINIQSVPLRSSDTDSTMTLQLGAASCTAGDLR